MKKTEFELLQDLSKANVKIAQQESDIKHIKEIAEQRKENIKQLNDKVAKLEAEIKSLEGEILLLKFDDSHKALQDIFDTLQKYNLIEMQIKEWYIMNLTLKILTTISLISIVLFLLNRKIVDDTVKDKEIDEKDKEIIIPFFSVLTGLNRAIALFSSVATLLYIIWN